MKIGSFQGISHAYYIKDGKNTLKTVAKIQNIDKEEAAKAVKLDISEEAKTLNARFIKEQDYGSK